VGGSGLTDGWQVQVGDTFFVGPRAVTAPLDSAVATAKPLWSLAQPDSTIIRAAAAILGREQRPPVMATRLTAAVRKRITLREDPNLRTAARVLASGSGNSQERAYLLTSLATAAGLQARAVWGLVWTEDGWVLRPWVEIWTETWTPYDVDGAGSDAGRIRLGTGGNSRFLTLALRAGRFRAQVLEETR
jgi:transglutaminase-like putative cysteine protease